MKLEKLQFYLLIMLLFLFVGCGGEPDKYEIKVEVKDNTEWNLTFVEDGQDMTTSLKKGTIYFNLPTSKGFFSSLRQGAKITLNPADSKECVTLTAKNMSIGKSGSQRACGPFLQMGVEPMEDHQTSIGWQNSMGGGGKSFPGILF